MLTLDNDTNTFYDAVADHYHLFYRDWQATLQREGSTLRRAFRDQGITRILDASCGPGTQAIALAQHKFEVTAADPSQRMLKRAHENAQLYNALDTLTFVRSDFLSLPQMVSGPFDAVITKGNSLPHLLTDADLLQALRNFYQLLRPGGLVMIGIRDFDFMLEDRPRFVPGQLHDDPMQEYILFDVWDWDDGPPITVTFNKFIINGQGQRYHVSKFPVTYRALRRKELEALLVQAGFIDLQCESQLWENVFTARKPS